MTEQQIQKILNAKKPRIRKVKIGKGNMLKVGIVSDTHLNSIHEKLGELHATYKFFKEHGVNTVLHAGDLTDGQGIYRGHENEIHTFGADRQVQYFCDNYPKIDGIKTYFITGNHDDSFYKKSGVDIGSIIARKRQDMMYIGKYFGRIELDDVRFDLVHGDSGGAYALSYKSQKYAEQIASGNKPQVLIFGHWHLSLYFWYREMHIFNAGCYQGQTGYLLRKGLNPCIGGWYLKIKHTGSKIHTITPNFIHL